MQRQLEEIIDQFSIRGKFELLTRLVNLFDVYEKQKPSLKQEFLIYLQERKQNLDCFVASINAAVNAARNVYDYVPKPFLIPDDDDEGRNIANLYNHIYHVNVKHNISLKDISSYINQRFSVKGNLVHALLKFELVLDYFKHELTLEIISSLIDVFQSQDNEIKKKTKETRKKFEEIDHLYHSDCIEVCGSINAYNSGAVNDDFKMIIIYNKQYDRLLHDRTFDSSTSFNSHGDNVWSMGDSIKYAITCYNRAIPRLGLPNLDGLIVETDDGMELRMSIKELADFFSFSLFHTDYKLLFKINLDRDYPQNNCFEKNLLNRGGPCCNSFFNTNSRGHINKYYLRILDNELIYHNRGGIDLGWDMYLNQFGFLTSKEL